VNEDDGVVFLAMEFVAGRSVGDTLEKGKPLDEKLALEILADVSRGLVEAHERGIIHRDIKPDNILFVRTLTTDLPARSFVDEEPLVKLSDFGLARHLEESESLRLTRTGAIVGTPLYLSPEQGAGSSEVGPASDVYSMGATLFHLLAGRPPFQGETSFQTL